MKDEAEITDLAYWISEALAARAEAAKLKIALVDVSAMIEDIRHELVGKTAPSQNPYGDAEDGAAVSSDA